MLAKIRKDNKYRVPNNMSPTQCLRNDNTLCFWDYITKQLQFNTLLH